eukprot:scaffold53217_cov52-Attheya_sp.AAC.6
MMLSIKSTQTLADLANTSRFGNLNQATWYLFFPVEIASPLTTPRLTLVTSHSVGDEDNGCCLACILVDLVRIMKAVKGQTNVPQ